MELVDPSDRELKLEFFFYSNRAESVSGLAWALLDRGYTAESGPSADDPKVFLTTGCTTKMKMSKSVIESWVRSMCEAGNEYDCEFDGWGTKPE